MVYALLARDARDGESRARLDDILAGKITLPTDAAGEPSVSPAGQVATPSVPMRDGKPDMEKLRETWGQTAEAQRRQQAADDWMTTMPQMGKGMRR